MLPGNFLCELNGSPYSKRLQRNGPPPFLEQFSPIFPQNHTGCRSIFRNFSLFERGHRRVKVPPRKSARSAVSPPHLWALPVCWAVRRSRSRARTDCGPARRDHGADSCPDDAGPTTRKYIDWLVRGCTVVDLFARVSFSERSHSPSQFYSNSFEPGHSRGKSWKWLASRKHSRVLSARLFNHSITWFN